MSSIFFGNVISQVIRDHLDGVDYLWRKNALQFPFSTWIQNCDPDWDLSTVKIWACDIDIWVEKNNHEMGMKQKSIRRNISRVLIICNLTMMQAFDFFHSNKPTVIWFKGSDALHRNNPILSWWEQTQFQAGAGSKFLGCHFEDSSVEPMQECNENTQLPPPVTCEALHKNNWILWHSFNVQ